MACSGPSQEHAFKIADEYTEKVLADLKDRYQVTEPKSSWPGLKEDHEKAKILLRDAIRELIWTEHCASW